MTQSRKSQVSLQDTKYYHLISRCVRKAYLCGFDKDTNKNFEHRRLWMVNRIRFLSSIFAIDIAAYALMSNHYHLVVHVNEEEGKGWSNEDVCNRWSELYHLSPLVVTYLANINVNTAIAESAIKIINCYRARLTDLSWLMRNLNEYVARKANKEDECKGRFWEGRFKSQALLDEKALLACMAYVDLNPIRAKVASSPSTSQFTSVFERIHDKASENDNPTSLPFKIKPLHGFIGHNHRDSPFGISFSFIDYLALVEATGRIMRADKPGYIDDSVQPLLQQLGINGEDWMMLAEHFGTKYHQAVGSLDALKDFAKHTHKKWISGQRLQSCVFD